MEKAKSLVMFAVKVFFAVAIFNGILSLLPGGLGQRIMNFGADPIGTLKGFGK